MGTHSGILSSYIHPTTFKCSRRSWRRWSRAGAELGLDSEEFVFRGGTHPNMVLAGLDVLHRKDTFTHVRIKVEEAEFPVH